MSYDMKDLLNLVMESNASDLHIEVGNSPCLRVRGEIRPVDGPVLQPEDTERLVKAIANDHHQQQVKEVGGADFSFDFMGKCRFRANILKSKGNYGIVLRQIPDKIYSMDELGLSDSVRKLLHKTRGLILVTGPTGSGKSTTLAAMINALNETTRHHIITIEDPIEYFHPHKQCLVVQREVGVDVPSFEEALRGALRQDPDVILVGEMRDLETIKAAIAAAETGHLVFGTLHTTGAVRTVDRIIDAFPENVQEQIRTQLAASILLVISQVLCPKIGGGRVAAYEIMVQTISVSQQIREGNTHRLKSDIQTGASLGMISLDESLFRLYANGLIEPAIALNYAQDYDEVINKMRQIGYPG